MFLFDFMFQLFYFVGVNCTFYVIPSKTDASSGAETTYPSGEREFNPGF
jgi:hypothetical protein